MRRIIEHESGLDKGFLKKYNCRSHFKLTAKCLGDKLYLLFCSPLYFRFNLIDLFNQFKPRIIFPLSIDYWIKQIHVYISLCI